MWRFAIQQIPAETCIEMTFFQWSQHVIYPLHCNDMMKPGWAYYFYNKKFIVGYPGWIALYQPGRMLIAYYSM